MDFHGRLDKRAEKDARVTVGQLLEFERQVEIVIIFARGEVAVLLVGAALANHVAVLVDIPLLRAVGLPARQVFAVEQLDLAAGLAGQLLDLQVAERSGRTVILQADHTAARKAVFGCGLPFAAVLAGEPVVRPGFEFEDLVAVEPVLDMAVVEDDARRVPLALRVDEQRIGIGQVHGVVHAQFLPLFEFVGGIDFFPALVVDQLVFGAGYVGYLEIGVFDHVVDHTAVPSVGEFPVPVEDEVFVLFLRNDVACQVAAVTLGLDAAVDDMPRHGQLFAVVVLPLVERLAVEQQLPAVGNLLFGQHILLWRTCSGSAEHESQPARLRELSAKISFSQHNL